MAPSSSRQIPQDVWERHKETILELRFDQGLPPHRDSSASQYEIQLKKWGAVKNLKKRDWQSILPIYDKLQERGLKPRLRVGDQIFGEPKIKRARRQYCQRAYDKIEKDSEPAASSTGMDHWYLEIRQSDGQYIRYSNEREGDDTLEELSYSPPTPRDNSLSGISDQLPQCQLEKNVSEVWPSSLLEQGDIENSLDSMNFQTPRFDTIWPSYDLPIANNPNPEITNICSRSASSQSSQNLMVEIPSFIQTELSNNLLDIGSDPTALGGRTGSEMDIPFHSASQDLFFPEGVFSRDHFVSILSNMAQNTRSRLHHALKSVNASAIFHQLDSLPSSDFFRKDLAENSALFHYGATSMPEIYKRIIYSMANNFAGLKDVPVTLVFSILRMAPGAMSHLFEIVYSGDRILSKTVADNIFRAAIEGGDVEALNTILKMTSDRPNEIDVNNFICKFNGNLYSPLALASVFRHFGIVQTLIAHDARISNFTERSDPRPIFINHPLDALFRQHHHPVVHEDSQGSIQNDPEGKQILKLFLNNEPRLLIECLGEMRKMRILTYNKLIPTLFQSVPKERYCEVFDGCCTEVRPLEEYVSLMLYHRVDDELIIAFMLAYPATGFLAGHKTPYAASMDLFLSVAIMERTIGVAEYELLLGHDMPTVGHLTAAINQDRPELIDSILKKGCYPHGAPICFWCIRRDTIPHSCTPRCAVTDPLGEAIRQQNSDLIRRLEAYGALDRISECVSCFKTAAFAALEVGNIVYLKQLLKLAPRDSREDITALPELSKAAIKLSQFEIALTMMTLFLQGVGDMSWREGGAVSAGCDIICAVIEERNPEVLEKALECIGGKFMAAFPFSSGECITEAVRWGKKHIVEDLLHRGFCPGSKGNNSALQVAIVNGNTELVVLLLESGFSPDNGGYPPINEEIGKSLLEVAVKYSNTKLAVLLLDWGASPNGGGSDGLSRTPLEVAIKAHNVELTVLLLNSGASPNGKKLSKINTSCTSPLGVAIETRNVELVILLLDRGASPNELEQGIKSGDEDMIQLLLQYGADPATDRSFLAALESGNRSFLNILITAYTSKYPCGKKGFGFLALKHAIRSRNSPLLDELLEAKLDANSHGLDAIPIVDRIRVHVLTLAIMDSNENAMVMNQMICSLLDAGADPEIRNEFGMDPFLEAVKSGNFHVVEMLLGRGLDINKPARRGRDRTPLQQACESGWFRIVEFLLNKGADVNAPAAMNGGGTAVQLAAIQGNIRVFRLLLDKGANIHAAPSVINGRTALEGAAEHGRMSILNILLAEGASGYSTKEIESARAYAEKEGNRGCEDRLKLAHLRHSASIEL